MKKVIEKIEKIKGVEKVTETGCNELTVKVEKKLRAVECTNKEQLIFAFEKRLKTEYCREHEQGCIYLNHQGWNLKEDIEHHVEIIPFSQYLSDYSLKYEWEKYLFGEAKKRYPIGTKFEIAHLNGEERTVKSHETDNSTFIDEGEGLHLNLYIEETGHCKSSSVYADGKWATIIEPELELISGEIYYDEDGDYSSIFRCKDKELDCYSRLMMDGNRYCLSGHVVIGKLKPATNKQKAKLIKSELKNGYLWNGKELVKYK